jgi:ribosomal protein L32
MNDSDYKGVRGGNPDRRPPKFEVTFPCKRCRRDITDVTDFGKPGKHICKECQNIQQGHDSCAGCGSYRGKMESHPDPYYEELRGDSTEYYFHKHCLRTSFLDI